MIGPTMIPAPQIAIALPCSSLRVDVEQHRLRQRHQRGAEDALQQCGRAPSRSRLVAIPQSIEVTTKPATEAMKSSRSPIRSESQPVTGVMIAEATM